MECREGCGACCVAPNITIAPSDKKAIARRAVPKKPTFSEGGITNLLEGG